MTSTFGTAFDKLPHETQRAIFRQLAVRKQRYLQALRRGYTGTTKIILLGDKPGPGRPKVEGLNYDPNWHHTPFYSTKNSSLWLNRQLVEAGIPEESLLWFNVEMASGEPLDPIHLQDLERLNPTIICLGGNAEVWVRRVAPHLSYVKVHHPQFAKRFRSKEPYALIDELKRVLT